MPFHSSPANSRIIASASATSHTAAADVALPQEHQVVEVGRLPQPLFGPVAERPVGHAVGVHVVGDEPLRPLGDRPLERG